MASEGAGLEQSMKIVLSALSLLVVLVIVGLVAKGQLQVTRAPLPADIAASAGLSAPVGTPAQQSLQIQKKVQGDVNKLMQQAPARLEPAQ
jgi:hypothetical protein